MQPFSEFLILALIQSGLNVRTMQLDPDKDSGLLRVTMDDGRVYSIHFFDPT